MTWASLWWRVCLLARLHARRVRVRWLLWRRSRRTLRLGRLGAPALPSLKAADYSVVNNAEQDITFTGTQVWSGGSGGFRMPGDIAYLPRRGLPSTAYVVDTGVGRIHREAHARQVLEEHEAMLQEQRDAMLKVES